MTKIGFSDRTGLLELDDMPALVGSEKQITWAEDIRRGLFDNQVRLRLESLQAQAIAKGATYPIGQMVERLNNELSPLYDRQTSAKYWIDNRNGDLQQMARKG